MSTSFWANRLTPQQQQQPAAPAPAPASTRPWWMPAQPAPAPHAVVQQPQAGTVAPSDDLSMEEALHQQGYHTERAQSARDSEHCPACGSPNYIAPAGIPNAMKQCFNCGENPRFAHSTQGASGIGQKNVAPPKAARVQVSTPPAGFPAMGSIVQHI